ncbi:rhodanese-like domain-containing protein [Nocardioides marmorisolisilvae]|uniref:Rhodanese-like domain-containing protein n=1 Tax=Nocardioides marmorisolisilvae TaxID=1542737 RepID=A0A3N0E0T5_9ACTN|nr:rhodanese-like domain-containing protein [Nocardioides marmorisolisilvae]RNL81430.1 rhodanese-like domain-containing protein [Nocardioides marmorisolisilvae]
MNGIPTVSVAQVPDPLPDGLFVVDVREPVEWAHGRIDGSVHIPMSQFVERIAEVPNDQQVLVVCKVGGRSAQVTQYLVQSGYEAVNLDGGVLEWAAAGRALVGDSGDGVVV